MYKRYILVFCFITLCASAVLYSNFHFKDAQYRKDTAEQFTHWFDDNRPTVIYAMPPSNRLFEIESMVNLLASAKKMGWNLVSEKDSHQLPESRLKNAFGIFQFNHLLNLRIPRKNFFPQNIPIILINTFVQEEFSDHHGLNLVNLLEQGKFYQDPRLIGLLAVTYPAINANESALAWQKTYPNLKFLMNWYLTVPQNNYQPHPNKLIYFHDPLYMKSMKEKYQKLLQALDAKLNFSLYGDIPYNEFKSFKGYPSMDGKSLVKEINKHGIFLMLHSEQHLKEGVPSSHLFEAAAAAALIIADRHPFIKREFKDSVLYIDESRDDILEQIENHLRWIKENPEEAKIKARLSHAIFLQKFTQEKQLARLYEYVQKYRKRDSQ